ncbi:hypothetical protein H109_02815 [Trichophyton interdigitale MR816]|uniref:Uncharacterized protein n=1 Tax=Trichophyton interdigitale (strain MR816) TaxID=1215338 RepID=A0A059JBX1_TRIIM|nr:hypothetical protein H101_03823 [Trichophyton interdigitale H6]KDB25350.1 hypothetical protein H109_02815 [Trichophyton interdigitale MR816]
MPNTVLSSMAPAAHNSDKLSLNRSMLAPSPTLTNPDMILPYGEERESSTPSPALEDLQRAAEQSRLLASSYSLMHQRSTSVSTTTSCDRTSSGPDEPIQPYAAAYGTVEGSPQAMAGSGASASASASASANAGAVSGPMQSSQMSDIDLTIRTQSRRQSRASSTNSLDSLADPSGSAGLGASNGLSKRHSKVRELQDLPSGLFEQDKAHPDDEGAGVLGGADDLSAVVFEPEHRILPMGAIAEEDEDGEEKTESSDRSDRVYDELDELTSMLENAKLKLTHMEGNLNRARSSFRMTPSPSPSLNRAFGSAGSSYHKHLQKGERRSQTSLAGALLRQRAHQGYTGNGSHLRGQSDLCSPSQSSFNRLSGVNGQFRSFSALGSTSASEYRTGFYSHVEEEEQDDDKEPTTGASTLVPEVTTDRSRSLTPSSQSAPIPDGQSRTSPLPSGDIKNSPSSSKSPPLINKPDSRSQSATPPSPASAHLQMRGLQGQVDGLRSKLSTLKERTQEESIRRRSQQSLRTPSPFTVADENYTNPLEYQRRSSYPETLATPNYNKPQSPPPALHEETHDTPCVSSPTLPNEEKQQDNLDDKEDAIGLAEDTVSGPIQATAESPIEGPVEEPVEGPVEEPIGGPIQGPAPQPPAGNATRNVVEETDESESEYFEYSDNESEPSEIDRQELEEILREPMGSPTESVYQDILEEFPSVPPVQETIRHEDRIDAFDYEHFILHSALGTYSGRLNRSGSICSSGSTETTRPDGRETPKNGSGSTLSRVTSNDSISTDATFATATEGDYGYHDALTSPNGNGTYWGRTRPSNRLSRQFTDDSLTLPTQQYYDSTSTFSRTQSASSTPRASISSVTAAKDENAALLASISELKKAAATPQTPGLLVRSILSSAANEKASDASALYSPQTGSLCDADSELVEAVIQSLGNVSLELLRASTANLQSPIDNRIVTILRRRLDAARRILDGVAPLETNP